MNCEQVEELLSPYLDNTLAQQEKNTVTAHLKECASCRDILTDFSRFDNLLTHMPRVSPAPELREKIFSSSEYLELPDIISKEDTVPSHSLSRPPIKRDREERPHLVSIPGGRSSTSASTTPHPSLSLQPAHKSIRATRPHWGQRTMQIVAAAALFLTLSMGGFIAWRLGQQQGKANATSNAITPPAALQTGPIPAGTRFVFLRSRALWSAATDGSGQIVQLTPKNVTVAPHWIVRPALPGHSVGNLIAYIDLQNGLIHIVRSDGQNDMVVQQPLLKAGVSPASLWNTQAGNAILGGLAWSPDGSTLAFIAAPTTTTQSSLYLYPLSTGKIVPVSLPTNGLISRPTWSPDNTRLAVASVHAANTDILDYNTHSKNVLTIVNTVNTATYPNDTLLSFFWSSNAIAPGLTWSVGTAGHVHSVWIRSISQASAYALAMGDFTQAIYHPVATHNSGAWLLASSQAGQAGFLRVYDLNANITPLVRGKRVSSVSWSPDSGLVSYLDTDATGVSTLHEVNISTGANSIIATGVNATPSPIWSTDNHTLVYSAGTQSFVFNQQKVLQLQFQGTVSAFSWSPTSPSQLVVLLTSGQIGTYLVTIQNAQKPTFAQVDKQNVSGSLLWTEIP